MSNPPSSTTSMFSGASHNTFNETTFVIQSERIAAFDRLKEAATPSAFHSFVGRPEPAKCYPNTRVALLEGLERWTTCTQLPERLFDARLDEEWRIERGDQLCNRSIVWLSGGAGAGKSAVAQTFAERCEDLGHIVASFFFFSTDNTRNSASRLVATLAYQIAKADRGARAHIETIVHHDPHIFDQDFKKQMISLILDPIQRSIEAPDAEGRQRRCIIIIDGLDECGGGEAQAGIVRAICDALRTGSSDPQKLLPCFLICSRPEEPVKRVFRSAHLQDMYTSIDLSRDTNAHVDIRTFLEGKLTEIKATHPRADLIPASWPSSEDIFTLLGNSSGHFIYAQTVIRLLSNNARPVAVLEAIVGLRALPQRVRESFAELDELYRHILLRALETCSINTIRHVLGFAMMGSSACSSHGNCDITERFLGLEDGELDTFLSVIPSLVFVDISASIVFYHKSFRDFLHDDNRAGQFHIEDNATFADVWVRCMDMAHRKASLDRATQDFVVKCALLCLSSSNNFLAGEKSHSLLGIIQRRDFSTIFDRFSTYDTNRAKWAQLCFCYWLELLRRAENSVQIIQTATGVMIDIIKDLLLDADPAAPLLMCQKPHWGGYEPVSKWAVGPGNCFAQFLDNCFPSFGGHIVYLPQANFSALKSLLENEEMGDFRLTGERFAESCLSWMTRLTKEVEFFPSKNRQVLHNQRSLILNESARRQQVPFQWRRIKQTIRPHQTRGRFHFLRNRQQFLVKVPEGGCNHNYNVLIRGYTHRELFFGSRSNLVLQKSSNMMTAREEEQIRSPSRSGDRKSFTLLGKKTAVRGYLRVRESFGQLFFLPLAKLAGTWFSERGAELRKWGNSFVEEDRLRRKQFRFVLLRLPAMLARASKSDAVAVLRSKAFPPLARCFPKLTRRAQQAMEEYAARHGYISPYINTGRKYTDITPRNENVVITPVHTGEIVIAPPPLSSSISTCGQKRRHRFPPSQVNQSSDEICHDSDCQKIINKRERVLTCSSPDCHCKYHLSCQGSAEVPLVEWFCDEGCERDAAVRKRMRYKL